MYILAHRIFTTALEKAVVIFIVKKMRHKVFGNSNRIAEPVQCHCPGPCVLLTLIASGAEENRREQKASCCSFSTPQLTSVPSLPSKKSQSCLGVLFLPSLIQVVQSPNPITSPSYIFKNLLLPLSFLQPILHITTRGFS